MRHFGIAVTLVVLSLASLLWLARNQGARASAADRGGGAVDQPGGPAGPSALAHPASAERAALTSSRDAGSDSELAERLAEFARIEALVARAGAASAEQQASFEALLRPTLERPQQWQSIVEHLVARTWRQGEAEELSPSEYGGVRFLYWGLVLLHSPGSPHEDRAAGRELFLALARSLPRMGEGLRAILSAQLGSIAIDGESLIALYLLDLVRLRAESPEHSEVYSDLITQVERILTAEERAALLGVLLADPDDPVLVASALRSLLQGERSGLALALAEDLFDAPGASALLRNAVALAVVESVGDVYQAAGFLESRADALRNAPQVWTTMSTREGGFLALEASYQRLLSEDADPRARESMVMGMRSTDPGELARVAQIALEDRSPSVRGQAFLTWTSSPAYVPSARDMGDLRSAYAEGVADYHVLSAASNIARRSEADTRRDAVELMREVALDARTGERTRRKALETLRGYLSEADYAQLEGALPHED